MPRKADRCFTTKDKSGRSFKVEKLTRTGSVQCITVEAPDGLFLVGRSYLTTHNSEQQGFSEDPRAFDAAYDWYTSGPRQRLQPGGRMVIVMTRWGKRDLTGQVIKTSVQRKGVYEWELIQLPAILPKTDTKPERPLWPDFWPLEELLKLRSELPISKWQAQYQQQPVSEEGAIIKRDWWKIWTKEQLPECEYIIQAWDTAYLKGQRNDYSACTTWGVFNISDDAGNPVPNICLLGRYKERVEFPSLKEQALHEYRTWKPDSLLVEAKASGWPLIQELRSMGIPVVDYTPSRGKKYQANDKVVRVNGIADLFASGMVWRPERRWAEEVMEEFAEFPLGEHDDLVDSSFLALRRFRDGGFIRLPTDEEEEEKKLSRYRKRGYY